MIWYVTCLTWGRILTTVTWDLLDTCTCVTYSHLCRSEWMYSTFFLANFDLLLFKNWSLAPQVWYNSRGEILKHKMKNSPPHQIQTGHSHHMFHQCCHLWREVLTNVSAQSEINFHWKLISHWGSAAVTEWHIISDEYRTCEKHYSTVPSYVHTHVL